MQLVLPALEAQWVRLGAPIAERLRPGLSAVQLNDIEASLGFDLPHELRELWAWHDGSDCTSATINRKAGLDTFQGSAWPGTVMATPMRGGYRYGNASLPANIRVARSASIGTLPSLGSGTSCCSDPLGGLAGVVGVF
jgi:hypothetical protein